MIIKEKHYLIKCDECDEIFASADMSFTCFKSKEEANSLLRWGDNSLGWIIKDGKHLCCDCKGK